MQDTSQEGSAGPDKVKKFRGLVMVHAALSVRWVAQREEKLFSVWHGCLGNNTFVSIFCSACRSNSVEVNARDVWPSHKQNFSKHSNQQTKLNIFVQSCCSRAKPRAQLSPLTEAVVRRHTMVLALSSSQSECDLISCSRYHDWMKQTWRRSWGRWQMCPWTLWTWLLKTWLDSFHLPPAETLHVTPSRWITWYLSEEHSSSFFSALYLVYCTLSRRSGNRTPVWARNFLCVIWVISFKTKRSSQDENAFYLSGIVLMYPFANFLSSHPPWWFSMLNPLNTELHNYSCRVLHTYATVRRRIRNIYKRVLRKAVLWALIRNEIYITEFFIQPVVILSEWLSASCRENAREECIFPLNNFPVVFTTAARFLRIQKYSWHYQKYRL